MRSSILHLSVASAFALTAACSDAATSVWSATANNDDSTTNGDGGSDLERRRRDAGVGADSGNTGSDAGTVGSDAGTVGSDAGVASDAVAPPPNANLPPCVPGSGTDYQVGPGAGQLASIAQVPWNHLVAGDTVRIFWRQAPYKEKFLVTGHGTAQKPIRVCGVKGPQGQRPIIDGKGATTGAGINYGTQILNQTRNVILVMGAAGNYQDAPEYLNIEGLEITGQYSTYSFTDNTGTSRPYDAANFAACLWIERGHHVVVRDNVIHDCAIGVYSRSIDPDRPGEDFLLTKDLLLSHNWIYESGVVGDEHEHTTYIQTVGVTYEFNHYGPLRNGALGGALKDRSVGTVIRFNFIEEGARSLDLVEAEDYATAAVPDPAYRTTFVYGNVIRALGSRGTPIHYGGDHHGAAPGSNWGEPIFRKGTLYFFDNTLVLTDAGSFGIFDISTTDEHAEVFNNVFYASQGQFYLRRSYGEVGSTTAVGGGTMNLGKNWITSGWLAQSPSNPLAGSVLTGTQNLIQGSAAPIDLATFAPLAGAAIRDVAAAPPAPAAPYLVDYQYDPTMGGTPRTVHGSAADLGAIEGN